MISAHKWN